MTDLARVSLWMLRAGISSQGFLQQRHSAPSTSDTIEDCFVSLKLLPRRPVIVHARKAAGRERAAARTHRGR